MRKKLIRLKSLAALVRYGISGPFRMIQVAINVPKKILMELSNTVPATAATALPNCMTCIGVLLMKKATLYPPLEPLLRHVVHKEQNL